MPSRGPANIRAVSLSVRSEVLVYRGSLGVEQVHDGVVRRQQGAEVVHLRLERRRTRANVLNGLRGRL